MVRMQRIRNKQGHSLIDEKARSHKSSTRGDNNKKLGLSAEKTKGKVVESETGREKG
jgi:hypothetical protein